jgi:hypothetical protein
VTAKKLYLKKKKKRKKAVLTTIISDKIEFKGSILLQMKRDVS